MTTYALHYTSGYPIYPARFQRTTGYEEHEAVITDDYGVVWSRSVQDRSYRPGAVERLRREAEAKLAELRLEDAQADGERGD